jgi:hypothetical protein
MPKALRLDLPASPPHDPALVIQHFALLYGAGILGLLPAVDHRRIPPSFFRLLVLLALPALGLALALGWRAGGESWRLLPLFALGVSGCAYLSMVVRGRMEAARAIGFASTGLAWGALVVEGRGLGAGAALGLFSAATGAGLLGSVLLAMLLGHAYLNIPGLPIVHLRRLGWILGGFIAARFMAVAIAAAIVMRGSARDDLRSLDAEAVLASDLPLLGMRLALGVLVPGILAVLVDRTARIRSTQSATGLLYVALVFVLFGELMASYLWVACGLP